MYINRWSGHVSFVGGKNEPGETDEETVKREVLEEIGIDLNSDDYIQLGKLNEREITSVKDNKLLMILIPFGMYTHIRKLIVVVLCLERLIVNN